MNKQKFVEFIRKPSTLSLEDMADLEGILSEYPYFQNARIILAKAARLKSLPDAQQKLASAAVYATNRALLKRYINDQLIFLRRLDVQESVNPQPRVHQKAPIAKTPETSAATAKKEVDNRQPAAKAPSEAKDLTQDQVDNTPASKETNMAPASGEQANRAQDLTKRDPESKPAVEKANQAAEAPTTPTPGAHHELDDLITDLWKDVDEMHKSRARLLEIEKKMEEEDAVNKAVARATRKTAQKNAAKPKTTKARTSTTKTKASTTRKTTTPTAKISSTATDKKKPTATTKKQPASNKTPENKKVNEAPQKKSPPEQKSEKPPADRQSTSQKDIIDNFIRSNPSMPPSNQVAEQNLGDLSHDSTELDPDIASEYLAEIFLEQGKKERAIQIYEVLMVKFPENSTYFADIIKKLTP